MPSSDRDHFGAEGVGSCAEEGSAELATECKSNWFGM